MKLGWILWEESGGVYEIVWLRVSDWRLQVCSIARSQPVSMKVCQHVWREPVLTDLQAFSLMCIFQDRLGHCLENAKYRKKNKNPLLSVVIFTCQVEWFMKKYVHMTRRFVPNTQHISSCSRVAAVCPPRNPVIENPACFANCTTNINGLHIHPFPVSIPSFPHHSFCWLLIIFYFFFFLQIILLKQTG